MTDRTRHPTIARVWRGRTSRERADHHLERDPESFLVYAARRHRGTRPRLLAQPPLLPRGEPDLDRAEAQHTPQEEAILAAQSGAGSRPGGRSDGSAPLPHA